MPEERGAIGHVKRLVESVATRLAWLPTALTVTLPVAAAVLFVFKGELTTWSQWVWVGLGVLALLANAFVQAAMAWWARQNSDAEIAEASRLRVALRDALQPVAEIIASMPYEKKPERGALLRAAATQSVSALILLMKDVDRARAVVYALDSDATAMSSLAHHGRGSSPSPFLAGTTRGDRALKLVTDGGHLFVADLDMEKPEEWEGSGSDYRTFISASINNGGYSYGMVTLDAPNAQDLGENEKHLVLLMADLLAIAFAEADR